MGKIARIPPPFRSTQETNDWKDHKVAGGFFASQFEAYGCFQKYLGWGYVSLLQGIWMFPKIGFFPPKSSLLMGVFHYIHHPFLGYPYFWKHPYACQSFGSILPPSMGVHKVQKSFEHTTTWEKCSFRYPMQHSPPSTLGIVMAHHLVGQQNA